MKPARVEDTTGLGGTFTVPLKKLVTGTITREHKVARDAVGTPGLHGSGVLSITDQRVSYSDSVAADPVLFAHRDLISRQAPTPDCLILEYKSPAPMAAMFEVAGTAQLIAAVCLGAAKAQQQR